MFVKLIVFNFVLPIRLSVSYQAYSILKLRDVNFSDSNRNKECIGFIKSINTKILPQEVVLPIITVIPPGVSGSKLYLTRTLERSFFFFLRFCQAPQLKNLV